MKMRNLVGALHNVAELEQAIRDAEFGPLLMHAEFGSFLSGKDRIAVRREAVAVARLALEQALDTDISDLEPCKRAVPLAGKPRRTPPTFAAEDKRMGLTAAADRVMHERAAKAAGVALEWRAVGSCKTGTGPTVVTSWARYLAGTDEEWAPTHDGNQALELAVKLHMIVQSWESTAETTARVGDIVVCQAHGTDALAATRRAIFHVAVSLGSL